MRLRQVLFGVAFGTAVGLLVVIIWNAGRDHTDWRARELTAWCNHYRNVARANRDQVKAWAAELSPTLARSESEYWFLHVSEEDWQRGLKILAAQRRLSSIEPWFARCAARAIPELPAHDAIPAVAYDLVRYLDTVLESVPNRDPREPANYVQPIEQPDQVF